jgi:hypothetical protein
MLQNQQLDIENIEMLTQNTSFAVADKVLLFDPTTKTGQHSKLKRRWSGPYFITEALDNFNFKLQELETGRDLERPVHTDRLRPLKELQYDYRLPIPDTLQQTSQCTTAQRNLAVRILVGDILSATAHAITHVTCSDPSQQSALSHRLFDTAGAGVLQTFRQHIDEKAPLTTGHCFITPAGNLNPIRRIVHINSSCDSDKVQAETSNCLQTVDTHQDNISSIAIPFFDSLGSNTDKHDSKIVGRRTKTVRHYSKRRLRRKEFSIH